MSEQKNSQQGIVVLTKEEVSMSHELVLTDKQLSHLLKKTPEKYIYERKAKGGGVWRYVKGVYVTKVLNLMFGWDWDFEIKNNQFDLNVGQAFVTGRLVCRTGGKTIVKEQFGRAEIKFKNEWVQGSDGKKTKQSTGIPLDLGNDMKAAATDALKKCASLLGIASDVYAPEEFQEVRVVKEETIEERVVELYDEVAEYMREEDRMHVERIIELKEKESYRKAIRLMEKISNEKNS